MIWATAAAARLLANRLRKLPGMAASRWPHTRQLTQPVRRCLRMAAALLFGLLLTVGACGCNSRDADRLATLGGKLERRAESLLAPDAARVLRGWRSAPFSLSEGAIDARVSTRLNWDKALAETPIQVKIVGGVAELYGKVRSEDQRRRAYELALTTQGVEKVLDRLEIGEPDKN